MRKCADEGEEEPIKIVIPPSVENLKLPSPPIVHYWKAAENRMFYIDFEVDDSLIEISKEIIEINREDKATPIESRLPIVLCVNTYGGDLDAAYSLISIIEASKTPVYTVNLGVSMSAGLLILVSGHKRFCMKRSRTLYHSGSAGIQGTYEQIEESKRSYDEMIKMMRDYIMDRTHIDQKMFNKNKNKDWYISDEEQVQLGIVDKIIDTLDEIL